jgi:hypothetical protein
MTDTTPSALKWVRITNENLPKAGDELLKMRKSDWTVYDLARAAGNFDSPDEDERYVEYFRPLNPPEREI